MKGIYGVIILLLICCLNQNPCKSMHNKSLEKWQHLLETVQSSPKWSKSAVNYKFLGLQTFTPVKSTTSTTIFPTPTPMKSTIFSTDTPMKSTIFPTHTPNLDKNSSTGEQSLPKSYQLTPLSDYYKIHYGTEKGLQHLKKVYGPSGLKKARTDFGVEDIQQADRKFQENYLRTRRLGRCENPKPRVFKVQKFHYDPAVTYLPNCVLLHVCDNTSGCCRDDEHCAPTAVENIFLYFYIFRVPNGIGEYIRLPFKNHSHCECIEINDRPRIAISEAPPPPLKDTGSKEHIKQNHTQTLDSSKKSSTNVQNLPHIKRCRECPVPFNSRIYRDGTCGCDCFDRQKSCLRIKKGRDPLEEVERRCVEARFCHIPDCEHGVFDSSTGYCPKKVHQSKRIRHSSSSHHRQIPSYMRWELNERD